MTHQLIMTGVISNTQTVILDQPLPPQTTGRVRLIIEPWPSFWQGVTLDELANLQQVKPITSLESLWGDFWPDDEPLDPFLDTIRQ